MRFIFKSRIVLVLSALVLALFYFGFYAIGRVPVTIVIDSLLVGLFVATTVSLRREALAAVRRGIVDGGDAFIVGVWGLALFLSLYFLYIIVYNSLGVPGASGPSDSQEFLRSTPMSGTLHTLILLCQAYIMFAPIGAPKDYVIKGTVLGLAVASAIGGIAAGIIMAFGFMGLFSPG